eukprot:128161_1
MAMSFPFKKIKNIDTKSKDIVFGYIKQHQSLLSNNIPLLINHMCLIYYFSSDKFDQNCIGKDLSIINETCVSMVQGSLWQSAILTRIINTGKYQWTFKILANMQSECLNDFTIDIGITDTNAWCEENQDKNTPQDTFFYERNDSYRSYAFNTCGHLYDPTLEEGYEILKMYAVKCKKDYIINMILDLDNLNLSYIINGHDYGVAFN